MSDSTYPGAIDTFVDPLGTDDTSTVDHSLQHRKANDALAAIEIRLGTSGISDRMGYDLANPHLTPAFPRTGTLYSKPDYSLTRIGIIAQFNAWFGMGKWLWCYDGGGSIPSIPIDGGSRLASIGEYLLFKNPGFIASLYMHGSLLPTQTLSFNGTNELVNSFRYNGSKPQRGIDPRHALCLAGTTLTATATAAATSLTVSSNARFAANMYAVICKSDFSASTLPEICLVTGITGGTTINVTRYPNSVPDGHNQWGQWGAQAWASGDIIRPIVGGEGSFQTPHINMLSTCPCYDQAGNGGTAFGAGPINFNQWLARFIVEALRSDSSGMTSGGGFGSFAGISGLFLDNCTGTATEELVPNGALSSTQQPWATQLDIYGTNTPTGLTDAQWLAGMIDMVQRIRTTLIAPTGSGLLTVATTPATYFRPPDLTPNLFIIGNPGGAGPTEAQAYAPWLNGGMIEGADHTGSAPGFIGTFAQCMAFYNTWMASAVIPPVFVWNGSSNRAGLTAVGADPTTGLPTGVANTVGADWQAMRLNLTACLQNDGFFVYDEMAAPTGINGNTHTGSNFQYDEFWVDPISGVPDGVGATPFPRGTHRGWLGYPISPSTQPIAGVFVRYYQNGAAICNSTGSSQTVALSSNHHRINATGANGQNGAVNSGGASGTSFTVPSLDGLVLIKG